jgi:hypothetical protein
MLKSWSMSSLAHWIWKLNGGPDSRETWGSKRKIEQEFRRLLCSAVTDQNKTAQDMKQAPGSGTHRAGDTKSTSHIQGTWRQDQEKLPATADENTNRKMNNLTGNKSKAAVLEAHNWKPHKRISDLV